MTPVRLETRASDGVNRERANSIVHHKATGVTLWKGEEPVDVTTIKLPATSLGEQLDLWEKHLQCEYEDRLIAEGERRMGA